MTRIFAILALMFALPVAKALAEDRMAGTVPVAVTAPPPAPEQKEEPEQAAAPKPDEQEQKQEADKKSQDKDGTQDEDSAEQKSGQGPVTAAPDTVSATVAPSAAPLLRRASEAVRAVNFTTLESYGTLNNVADGALGIDLWNGTRRAEINDLLGQMPLVSPYRTIQDLTRRLLLSPVDPALIRGDRTPAPGEDLLTLRIEKLMQRGAYAEAATLYKRYPDEPYHERLARNGVLALFYSQQAPVACVDTLTVRDRFEDQTFWAALAVTCHRLFGGAAAQRAALSDQEETALSGSVILQQVAADKKYRFHPRNLGDLEQLSPIERAVLFAAGRVNYAEFAVKPTQISPDLLGLLINDPVLPEDMRFVFMGLAARQGTIGHEALVTYYKDSAAAATNDRDNASQAAHRRIPALYVAASDEAASAKQRAATLTNLLEDQQNFSTANLLPFAPLIAATDPALMPKQVIRPAFILMTESGANIPAPWQKKWIENFSTDFKPEKHDALIWLAAALSSNTLPEFHKKNPYFTPDTGDFTLEQRHFVSAAYEKLDKADELLNYGDEETYEKDMGLTLVNDYVMPSSSLVDGLANARRENRLGETILLSAIVLHEAPPGALHPDLLSEVIDGFVAVGLTNEARKLAQEAVLGLSNTKGE